MSQRLAKHRADLADLKKSLEEKVALYEAQGSKVTDAQNEEWQAGLLRKSEIEAAIQRELDLIEFEKVVDAMPKEQAEALEAEVTPKAKPQSPKLFASMGEQLQAIANATVRNGAYVDPRLNQINAAILGTGTSPLDEGGYFIQTDLASEIWQLAVGTGELASRCTRMPLGAGFKSMEVITIRDTSRADGYRWGGVTVSRTAESGAPDATKIKFDKWAVEASAMMGLAYYTHEQLRDAPQVEALTRQAITDEFGVVLDEEIYTGSGGGGSCKGFMNSGSKLSVSKETGQAAASLVPQNIVKMYNRLYAKWRANAVWFANQDIEPQLHLMTLPIGTAGIPVFLPPAGLPAAPNGMLYGKPIVMLENCPTLGTEGDIFFADMSQFVLVEKEGLRVDRSDHVAFTSDQVCFRFKLEVGGQPKYNEAITPKKGSNTYSAFVTLATRS